MGTGRMEAFSDGVIAIIITIMWANMHLLFWLSLVPFVTAWAGNHRDAPVPAALYGVVLLMAGVAYFIMERQMVRENGPQSMLAEALGRDRKAMLSMVGYVVAIVLAFVSPRLAELIYALVAVMWIVPDRRIASRVRDLDLSG